MSPSDPAGPQCSVCDQPNGPSARFCKGCGARLHQAVPDAPGAAAGAHSPAVRPASDVCPRCGEVLGPRARACRNCGAKLADSLSRDAIDSDAVAAPIECLEEEVPYTPYPAHPDFAPQPQSRLALIVLPWARKNSLVFSLAGLVAVLAGLLAWILVTRSGSETPSGDTQIEEPVKRPSSPARGINDHGITESAPALQVEPERVPPVERPRRPPPTPKAIQIPEPTPSGAVSPAPAPVELPRSPPTPSLITSPTWARRPSGSDLARFYPDRAAERGVQGATVTECAVAPDGSLRIASSCPKNQAEWVSGALRCK